MTTSKNADSWREDLRRRLVAAMKARDTAAVAALRSAVSAIDNAQTAEAPDCLASPALEQEVIAGGVAGLGAGDVPRRDLSAVEVELILRREIAERRSAAIEYLAGGKEERAALLEAEALVIEGVLRDSGAVA